MKVLSRTELERSLNTELRPLYLLVGPEIYLRRIAAQAITEVALSGTLLREFNECSFSLLTDSVQSAIAAAEQFPMMSDRRVVRIRDFARLREADEESLIRYLNNPAASTVMILTLSSSRPRRMVSSL